MTPTGPAHPLDVELADLVDGALDVGRAENVAAHLDGCVLCRAKCQRLRNAPAFDLDGVPAPGAPPPFAVPAHHDRGDTGATAGQLWLAGGPDDDQHLLVVILRVSGDRVAVAPVTLDTEAADEEAAVVSAAESPVGLALVVYPALATEVPVGALVTSVGDLTLPLPIDGAAGTPVTGPTDPRLDIRQHLADRLAAMEDVPPDPGAAADAPAPSIDQVRSTLVGNLRSWRGNGCAVRPLPGWLDAVAAARIGWDPVVVVDEIGVVLVVFDTPHGLVDDEDFDAARSVLTRFNATAVVVLARRISGEAEIFDAPALNYGIEAPSGARTPPRPLITGLAAVDAILKFLDQSTGARAMSLPARTAVTRIDVGQMLRDAAATAVSASVKQASKFKIAPKRRAYESLSGAEDLLGEALARALAAEPVVEDLLGLARAQRGQRRAEDDAG